jgi:isopentenyldiphosphate isomerase
VNDKHLSSSTDDEVVDIYDDSGKRIGTASRLEAHRKGLWHYNFHCWVVTRREGGALIFQQRADVKPSFPRLLDSTVGGHYSAGERLKEVMREIDEEIGVRVGINELVPIGSRIDVAYFDGISKHEVAQVFLLESERPLTEYRLSADEVTGLLEIPIDAGLKLFSDAIREVPVKGVRWDEAAGRWRRVRVNVTKKSFVPKMDSYYMNLFITAKRFLSGERYLSI